MHLNTVLTLSAASFLVVSTLGVAAETSSSSTMTQLRKDHPRLRLMDRAGKIHKLVDKQLATGVSPKATADAFITKWSSALEVDPKEFIERGPFPDGHSEQQLMFNRETGAHKFTGVYYMQTANGLPVYDSRLMVLVRNVDGYPATAATTDLFDVRGFKKSKRVVMSDAVAMMAAVTRLGKGTTISTPELMVFAGTENTTHVPTAVLVYEATRGGHWDLENYSKLELVVDAKTGSILHEQNLILHVDGNVSGLATESSGADVCEPESSMGMPYAKVTLGGNTEYADSAGNYSINGSGTLTSTLEGEWFDVENYSGSNVSMSQNSMFPDFLHNASNNSESDRAQVNAYLQSNIVRDFTLAHVPSFLPLLNETFPVNVGVSGTCNAFYDYESINFYDSGGGCSNTAFSVIVHHEYGHHLVAVAGSGQDAYGEGMGDVMGVLITGDSELARGFYSNDCNNGLRSADNNLQYPCSGPIHDCGQLISGCVWDTLQTMEASYPGEGHAIVSTLAVNSMMLHSGGSINDSITLDWLVLDDNDGDLDNGTPHAAQINAGFAMHNMDYDIPMPEIYISYPNGRPSLFDPYGGTKVAINADVNTSPPIETGYGYWNTGSGWQQTVLSLAAESDYEFSFPSAECGEALQWYVAFHLDNGAIITSPSNAPGNSWSSIAGSGYLFEDNFQSNLGWVVSGDATDGQWSRSVPAGGGDRCDPPTDIDGSGSCYVTDNVDGNSDVDGGSTILTSPVLDASKGGLLSYYRWYNNGTPCDGQDPHNDYFYVDISSDGGSSWTNLETVGPIVESDGGWYAVEYDLSSVSGFIPSANFKVRFVCGDLSTGSVVEAAIDGFILSQISCDDPTSCTGDINGDSVVDVSDLLDVVSAWGESGVPADVNGDGEVNVSDLLAVVEAWGPCP